MIHTGTCKELFHVKENCQDCYLLVEYKCVLNKQRSTSPAGDPDSLSVNSTVPMKSTFVLCYGGIRMHLEGLMSKFIRDNNSEPVIIKNMHTHTEGLKVFLKQ